MVILEILSTQRASVYSEASHLLLDLVRCPYLDRTFKAKMITNSFQTEFGRKPTSKEVKENIIVFHFMIGSLIGAKLA